MSTALLLHVARVVATHFNSTIIGTVYACAACIHIHTHTLIVYTEVHTSYMHTHHTHVYTPALHQWQARTSWMLASYDDCPLLQCATVTFSALPLNLIHSY